MIGQIPEARPPLTVVCCKWKPPRKYRSDFGPQTVRVLRNMVARHYQKPHRFVCLTDDPKGLDDIETMPIWTDFAEVPSPHGLHQPSCYRRLKLYSPEMKELLGPRFVALDLDTVITGDMVPIWDRPEDFVIWGETNPKSYYNGSMVLMSAGVRAKVLEQFNPKTSPNQAKSAGKFGSDQGWISYILGKGEATWTTRDGVYSYQVHLKVKGPNYCPPDAKVIMMHGNVDPWGREAQRFPWVKEHWR